MEYRIVHGMLVDRVVAEINQALDEGWELHGPLVSQVINTVRAILLQPMTREGGARAKR